VLVAWLGAMFSLLSSKHKHQVDGDINWDSMTENTNANDKYITKLLEIYASFQQTKIQDLPTRQNNLLNIIVTYFIFIFYCHLNPSGYKVKRIRGSFET
jgi:hypothetical protein